MADAQMELSSYGDPLYDTKKIVKELSFYKF